MEPARVPFIRRRDKENDVLTCVSQLFVTVIKYLNAISLKEKRFVLIGDRASHHAAARKQREKG